MCLSGLLARVSGARSCTCQVAGQICAHPPSGLHLTPQPVAWPTCKFAKRCKPSAAAYTSATGEESSSTQSRFLHNKIEPCCNIGLSCLRLFVELVLETVAPSLSGYCWGLQVLKVHHSVSRDTLSHAGHCHCVCRRAHWPLEAWETHGIWVARALQSYTGSAWPLPQTRCARCETLVLPNSAVLPVTSSMNLSVYLVTVHTHKYRHRQNSQVTRTDQGSRQP